MPPPVTGKRMTANPIKPARYRPGKAVAEAHSSDDDDEDEEGEEGSSEREEERDQHRKDARSQPRAVSGPRSDAKKITSNLKNVDLSQRWKQQEARERAQKEEERRERERMEREAGFVTESSESGSDGEEEKEDGGRPRAGRGLSGMPGRVGPQESSEEEDSDSEEEGGSEESSSEDEVPKKLFRPVFVRKDQRGKMQTPHNTTAADSGEAEAASLARRQVQADELVEERIKLDAIARAAGKKSWDDEDIAEEEYPDDTDDLDPELEQKLWEARELSRVKRARQALEEREKEIAELERRRALTSEERDKEDQAFLAQQDADRKERGQMAHMQRYHHRGAFFVEDEDNNSKRDANKDGGGSTSYRELARRDLMGARYQDQDGTKAALPEFLQVRDATRIGKKGRTKYKDMKSEDTGRWGGGDFGRDRPRARPEKDHQARDYADVLDERFKPDRKPSGGTDGPSGANASSLGDRKRPYPYPAHHDDGDRQFKKKPRP